MPKKISIIISLFSLSLSAMGQGIPMWEAVDSIATGCREQVAADAAMEARMASLKSVNNLADPELEFEHQWGAKSVGNKWMLGVSQSFDWPGLYGARAASAKRMADEAVAERNLKVAQTRWAIEDHLLELRSQLDREQLLQAILANYTDLAAAYQRSFDMGEGNILDVKKLRVQQLSVDGMIGECQTVIAQAVELLKGYNPSIDYKSLALSLLEPKLPDSAALEGVDYSWEYLLALASLRSAEAEVDVARREGLPGFSVGYTHNYELGDRFNGISASMTLPFWSNRHKSNAAKAEILNRQAELEAQQNALLAKAQSQLAMCQSLSRRLEEYRKVVGDESPQRLLRMALDGGQISLMEYIQDINYFLEAQLEALSLQSQLRSATAELYRIVPL